MRHFSHPNIVLLYGVAVQVSLYSLDQTDRLIAGRTNACHPRTRARWLTQIQIASRRPADARREAADLRDRRVSRHVLFVQLQGECQYGITTSLINCLGHTSRSRCSKLFDRLKRRGQDRRLWLVSRRHRSHQTEKASQCPNQVIISPYTSIICFISDGSATRRSDLASSAQNPMYGK